MAPRALVTGHPPPSGRTEPSRVDSHHEHRNSLDQKRNFPCVVFSLPSRRGLTASPRAPPQRPGANNAERRAPSSVASLRDGSAPPTAPIRSAYDFRPSPAASRNRHVYRPRRRLRVPGYLGHPPGTAVPISPLSPHRSGRASLLAPQPRSPPRPPQRSSPCFASRSRLDSAPLAPSGSPTAEWRPIVRPFFAVRVIPAAYRLCPVSSTPNDGSPCG